MPTIFDLVKAKEIAAYIAGNPSNTVPYLGATLFPSKKQLGLDISWIKGANGLPVVLRPSAFDTKATLRDRIGVTKIETEMPFFREAMRVGEKDRQEINRLVGTGNAQYYMPIINNIFDDAGKLVTSADVSAERMRMQLLSTGKISITDNRQLLDYDYNLNAAHKETLLSTAKWSDTENSNPVADIQRWQDAIENDTGERPARALCTRKTWNYLLTNKKIKLDMNPAGGQNIIFTDEMLKTYIQSKLGLTIAVYTKKFIDETGAAQLFFPDDYFTLLPTGNLGNTYYGTTPEEADLMSGSTAAEVAIVNTGVAVTTIKEAHPVNVETIVSEIVLPSFENIDKIFIGKVN
jgi:hypothetical protein